MASFAYRCSARPKLVGEPRLAVDPPALDFGPVEALDQRILEITLENVGFGNIGLALDPIESPEPDVVRIENPPFEALLPGERWIMSVVYAPTTEAILTGALTLKPIGSPTLWKVVPLLGTSVPTPRLVTEPETRIDFGEVDIDSRATAALELTNFGAEPLIISSVDVFEPSVGRLEAQPPEAATSTPYTLFIGNG